MAKSKEARILDKARSMHQDGVDFRVFSNTFFGADSELLRGLDTANRKRLVQSSLYRELKSCANDLGLQQGYLLEDRL